MNIKYLLIITLSLFLLASGCKKEDLCEDVVCYNGGVCVDGNCDCPPAWTGLQCETAANTTPCNSNTCLNGGVCITGTCNCPTGYTGVYCQTSTTTNSCGSTTCLNGGVCVSGTCNCPTGWTGMYCQTPIGNDPCAAITCYNGGYCANGVCNCPVGWGGSDCSIILTPSSISVTKIEVLNFPSTDGGAGWDLTSGADIIVELENSSNTLLYSSPTYFENATPGLTYSFTPSSPIVLNNPTLQYTISLYDYDSTDPNDFMGGYYFTPYQSSKPSVTTISATGNPLLFRIYYTYQY